MALSTGSTGSGFYVQPVETHSATTSVMNLSIHQVSLSTFAAEKPMTLFRSNTHRDVWRERWCETCYEPHEAARRIQGKQTICPIWERALRTDRKPKEWDRMPRSDEMERSIKCNAYTATPPVTRRGRSEVYDVPMFDVEPHEARLVPVEGWPDKPRKDGVDHA